MFKSCIEDNNKVFDSYLSKQRYLAATRSEYGNFRNERL